MNFQEILYGVAAGVMFIGSSLFVIWVFLTVYEIVTRGM